MIIPVGFGQVTYTFSGSGVPLGAAVTFGFDNSVGVTATVAAALLEQNFETTILPELVQNTGLESTIVKLGPNATGPTAIATSGVGGGDLSAQAPPNVAYLVRKNTNTGGRKGRGRFYLPGVDETQVLQGGTVDTPKFSALQTAVDDFFDACAADSLDLVLLHTSVSDAPTAITGLQLQATVATQRRRLRR